MPLSEVERVTHRRAPLIGLGAGLFSGLFGVGGGVIVVPAVLTIPGVDERTATAASLAGTAIQQRLPVRAIRLLLALLLIGGGALFVPALVFFLGLDQIHAEATSLLAIVPTSLVGTLSQYRYGNLRWRLAAGGWRSRSHSARCLALCSG